MGVLEGFVFKLVERVFGCRWGNVSIKIINMKSDGWWRDGFGVSSRGGSWSKGIL